MSVPASIEFDLFALPPQLRFDGIMVGPESDWLQFTELDQSVPSYGASFYIDTRAALLSAITARREHKRKQFAGEAPLED